MQRQWSLDDLIDHFTLLPHEYAMIMTARMPHTRLSFAILLKCFLYQGSFPPQRSDVPLTVIEHLAQQLDLPLTTVLQCDLHSRSSEEQRAQIRTLLGFREATVQDATDLTAWLTHQLLQSHDQHLDRLRALASTRCRDLKREPPRPDRMTRILHAVLAAYHDRLYTRILERLAPVVCEQLDGILTREEPADPTADPLTLPAARRTIIQILKTDPGPLRVETAHQEVAKLERLRAIGLPTDLFVDIPLPILRTYQQRVSAEQPHELRRHPQALHLTLLAAFCYLR